MQISIIPCNQPLLELDSPHLIEATVPLYKLPLHPPPHTHPKPHQPHRGSWAGPWNLMTSLSLPSWNSKPCCSPLAYSYHLHGNLTSSCFPIGFMEQDTQKGFPFCPHCPPAKMMLSTGTWAKFSHLRFCVLWLRKHGNVLLPIVYSPLNHTPKGLFLLLSGPQLKQQCVLSLDNQLEHLPHIQRTFPTHLLPSGEEKKQNNNKNTVRAFHVGNISLCCFLPP